MNVLLSEEAFKNIKNLNEVVNLKDLYSLNNNTGKKYSKYHPWMSSWFQVNIKNNLDFFETLDSKELVEKDELKLVKLNKLLAVDGISFKLINSMSLNNEGICSTREEIESFESLLNESLALIERNHSLLGKYTRVLISKFILRVEKIESPTKTRLNGTGLSSHFYRGGVFLSHPRVESLEKIDLAVNIIHELGHHVLMIYQRFDSIIKGDLFSDSYSAVRKTIRPSILSIHALVASYFMIIFIKRLLEKSQLSQVEIDHLDSYLGSLVFEARKSISCVSHLNLTSLGTLILDEINIKLASIESRETLNELA